MMFIKGKGKADCLIICGATSSVLQQSKNMSTFITIFHIQLDGSHLGLLKHPWPDVGI